MTLYDKQSPESIQKMFGSIAKKYDRGNAILSMHLHKLWNAELVRQITKNHSPMTLLDLCSGTGDIAFKFLKTSKSHRTSILVDFCPEMLAHAKAKAYLLKLNHHCIKYLHADVQNLPLQENYCLCAYMAYGIRNVKDPLKCFQEVFRVLKPGGVFGILELTKPSNPLVRIGHSLYLRKVLPLIGKWISANQAAYEYLCNSIHHFVPPAQLIDLLKQAGFIKTKVKSLTFGTATILIGYKPE